jgi:hypothetical protein
LTNDKRLRLRWARRITRLHEMETREKLRAAKTTNSGRYWHSFPWVVARVPLPFFAAIGPYLSSVIYHRRERRC